jgi:hypothetical protein
MAVTNFSTLLGLALPTTGDLSGTWGTTVNDAITALLDSAIAGTTTLSANADVTLTTTNGSANQAREAILLWTASNGATTRNITAPAQSKAYVVINAGTGSIVVRGSGPTAGVTIISGEKALVAWNGSDFVNAGGGSAAGSNTQVQFNSSGAFGASSALTWDGTSLSATKFAGALNGTVGATTPAAGAFTTLSATTALPNTSGGTGQNSAFTQYGVTYASTTTALATTAAGTAGYVLTANSGAAPTFQAPAASGVTQAKATMISFIFGY